MAIAFTGKDLTDINWDFITKIEVRDFLIAGPYQDIGYVDNSISASLKALYKPGDPSNSYEVFAIQLDLSFKGRQTAKTGELANYNYDAGVNLFDRIAGIRLTSHCNGRTITLGEVSGYPIKLIGSYYIGSESEPSYILYETSGVFPYTTGFATLFSA